jgi:type IV pilus assembly protein PilM
MEEAELKQALKFEAQKHIPFPINEVKLDSYILRDAFVDNKMLVLVAAVKRDFISQRLKIIQEAGFKINIVDLDSIALINAFNFNYPKDENTDTKNKAVALLNIGASMSNLSILENGLPVLSRDIYIAGNNLTQKIQDLLGLDYKAAEGAKFHIEKDKSEKLNTATESVLSDLAKELRVSFDYYESQSTSSVTRIFLSGGGAVMTGFKDALANLLGFEVEYWDPLRKVIIPENIDSKNAQVLSGQLAVAVGLALRR